MAISNVSTQFEYGIGIFSTSADASDCEVILAGTADKRIKLRHVSFINLTAGSLNFTLGGGDGGAAVSLVLIGPIAVGANSTVQYDFNPKMVLAVNTALALDLSGAGNIATFVQGVVE